MSTPIVNISFRSIMIQYLICPPSLSITEVTLLGIECTRLEHTVLSIALHTSWMTTLSSLMFEGWRCSTFLFRTLQMCSMGLRSDGMLGQSITFTFFRCRKAVMTLAVCLGSLSCWNVAPRLRWRRECSIFSCRMVQYISAFMMPSMKWRSPMPCALNATHTAPNHDTSATMLHCVHHTVVLIVFLMRSAPYFLDTIWAEEVADLCLVRPQYLLPEM